ncbi:MAG TPA: hypothetical protein VE912_20320 [Bacteroidales bacterium]|nr:hypothetical protein [Bacteroidales bacterium]
MKITGISLRFFIVVLLAAGINLNSRSQGVKPQNVYYVTVLNQYVMKDGDRTSKFWAIGQKVYDSLHRLHTEIMFDFDTHQPVSYKWNYFDSLVKVKTAFFEHDTLQKIETYTYNTDSLLTEKKIFKVRNGDTALFRIVHYIYNGMGKPEKIEAENATGKLVYRVKSTYDAQGTEIKRKVKTKSGFPADSILKLSCTPSYDSLNRLASRSCEIQYKGRGTKQFTCYYEYDDQGHVTGLKKTDAKGQQISLQERIYQRSRNRLSQVKFYDASDTMVRWIANRYEIYPTKDRRHRQIDY